MALKEYHIYYNFDSNTGRWYLEKKGDAEVGPDGHAKMKILKKADPIKVLVHNSYFSEHLITCITPREGDPYPFVGDNPRVIAGKGTACSLDVKEHIIGRGQKVDIHVRIDPDCSEEHEHDSREYHPRSDTDIHIEC